MSVYPEEAIEMVLFAKANTYSGSMPLIFPNDIQPKPADLSGHWIVTHFRNGNVPYALEGDGDTQTLGMLQFLGHFPLGEGPNKARKLASEIVELFWNPPNLSLSGHGVRVRVSKRPVLGTGLPLDTSYAVPVSIFYEVFI